MYKFVDQVEGWIWFFFCLEKGMGWGESSQISEKVDGQILLFFVGYFIVGVRIVLKDNEVFFSNKKGDERMGVVYKVVYEMKGNVEKTDKEMEEIVTKKLLRVILNLESSKSGVVDKVKDEE